MDCWATNDDVRLHYLDTEGADPALLPLLYIPGGLGPAEQFRPDMPLFAPRRTLSASLRGSGQSDGPPSGYALEHFVSDIGAVVDGAGIRALILMAFSVGVPYALGYASEHPERVKGLILCDYPARYPAYPPAWAERVLANMPPGMARPHVVRAVQAESAEVLLWERLERITCPALILQGGQPGALLKEDHVELYRRHLPQSESVKFEDAGHALWMPDHDRYIGTVRAFVNRIG